MVNWGKEDDMFEDANGQPYQAGPEPQPYRYEPNARVFELRGQLISRMRTALSNAAPFLRSAQSYDKTPGCREAMAELLALFDELRR